MLMGQQRLWPRLPLPDELLNFGCFSVSATTALTVELQAEVLGFPLAAALFAQCLQTGETVPTKLQEHGNPIAGPLRRARQKVCG